MQLSLLLPFITKLHQMHRKWAWILLAALIIGSIAARAGIIAHYHTSFCPDFTLQRSEVALMLTSLYNKPFVPFFISHTE